jgi:hypothetical protein
MSRQVEGTFEVSEPEDLRRRDTGSISSVFEYPDGPRRGAGTPPVVPPAGRGAVFLVVRFPDAGGFNRWSNGTRSTAYHWVVARLGSGYSDLHQTPRRQSTDM